MNTTVILDHADLIAQLQTATAPVAASDTMAEAGRKSLLQDFIKMLKNEAGSRGENGIEPIHDMRVSTRRMRSTFRLLEAYYKPKAVRLYNRRLQRIARALGNVRDIDVIIEGLQAFQPTLTGDAVADLQGVIDTLHGERDLAHYEMLHTLNKGDYRRFVDDFARFVLKSGDGARVIDTDEITPSQVRYLAPTLLYEHLGAVRTYNEALADASEETLHSLRIEFKRLRYALSIFEPVLGVGGTAFLDELRGAQDHLGRLNDAHVAHARLSALASDLSETQNSALQGYLKHLDEEAAALRETFGEVWRKFNSKIVQRQLATSLAGL